jgi:hypothetical protein
MQDDLEAWERDTWLPSGDDLPNWLTKLRKQHTDALDAQKAASWVVGEAGCAEAESPPVRVTDS